MRSIEELHCSFCQGSEKYPVLELSQTLQLFRQYYIVNGRSFDDVRKCFDVQQDLGNIGAIHRLERLCEMGVDSGLDVKQTEARQKCAQCGRQPRWRGRHCGQV